MSNTERDSLVSKIEQLEPQHQVLAKYIAAITDSKEMSTTRNKGFPSLTAGL